MANRRKFSADVKARVALESLVRDKTLDRFDAMEFATDLSQVLYPVGLAAAAAQSVGLFN